MFGDFGLVDVEVAFVADDVSSLLGEDSLRRIIHFFIKVEIILPKARRHSQLCTCCPNCIKQFIETFNTLFGVNRLNMFIILVQILLLSAFLNVEEISMLFSFLLIWNCHFLLSFLNFVTFVHVKRWLLCQILLRRKVITRLIIDRPKIVLSSALLIKLFLGFIFSAWELRWNFILTLKHINGASTTHLRSVLFELVSVVYDNFFIFVVWRRKIHWYCNLTRRAKCIDFPKSIYLLLLPSSISCFSALLSFIHLLWEFIKFMIRCVDISKVFVKLHLFEDCLG